MKRWTKQDNDRLRALFGLGGAKAKPAKKGKHTKPKAKPHAKKHTAKAKPHAKKHAGKHGKKHPPKHGKHHGKTHAKKPRSGKKPRSPAQIAATKRMLAARAKKG